MKRLLFTALLALIFFSNTLHTQSQMLVNQIWEVPFGTPTDYDWAASVLDASGNLITTGHSTTTPDAPELLLLKHETDGDISWQSGFEIATGSKNYGTALASDASGNIYVAGTSYESDLLGKQNFVVLKYNSNGTKIWHTKIDGTGSGDDIPTAILFDDGSKIYVTGISYGNGTERDYLTTRLDAATGSIDWQQRYDYANLDDIPVDMDFDQSGNIVVTGISAESVFSWELATIKYSPTGTLLSENRVSNSGVGFDLPSGMAKDDDGNLYITGTSSPDAVEYDIKTVKLNSDFTIGWQVNWDGASKPDSASAIGVDPNGNVIVTGWTTNEKEGRDFLTIKYDSLGNILWQQRRHSNPSTAKTEAKKLVVDDVGNITIAGEIMEGTMSYVLVLEYDSEGNILWEKKLAEGEGSKNKVVDLQTNGEGKIFVTTVTERDGGKRYRNYEMERCPRELTPVYGANEQPLYVSRELIVRYKANILNKNFINNVGRRFGTVDEIIEDSNAIDSIDQKLGANGAFSRWKMIKVHRRMTTADAGAVTHQGKGIAVPEFWATFILLVPRDYSAIPDIPAMCDTLEATELKPYILFAEPNHAFTLDNCPPDDPRWHQQGNLHTITYQGVTYDKGHINMEPGWCIEQGKGHIRVGIMGSGIFSGHEDFGGMDWDDSVVDGGYNYFSNADVTLGAGNDEQNHETKVAGLIGAIRNNELGVGAIAGGEEGTGGVRLYDFKLFTTGNWSPYSDVLDAYYEAVYDHKVTVINHSGGLSPDGNPDWTDANIEAFREKLHFANRMGVVIAASRGNPGTDIARYPCTSEDKWILCTGGSGLNGEYDGYNFGKGLDVVGPARWQLNRTPSTNPSNLYEGISFTSGATPNVAGLASLLVSYYNEAQPASGNLVQEDVEYVIQATADDIDDDDDEPGVVPGYDDYTGFGKINAGEALELVEKPNCNIFHFGRYANAGQNIQFQAQVEEDVDVTLTEPYNKDSGGTVDKGDYVADVYKVVATFQHDLPAGYTFVDAWARHSNSTVLPKYVSGGDLLPVEDARIVSVDGSSITLEGYVYNLQGGGWIPQFVSSTETDLAYSVLACQTTDTEDFVQKEPRFEVFPNPATSLLNVGIVLPSKEDVQIEVIDSWGRVLYSEKWSNYPAGGMFETIDVSDLLPGIYFCRFITPSHTVTKSFVKS